MPYLRNAEIRTGVLVIYQCTTTLETMLSLIVNAQDSESTVELLLPDGSVTIANKMYLRRIPDESR